MFVKDVVEDLVEGRRSVEEAVDQLLERKAGYSAALDDTFEKVGKAAADTLGVKTKWWGRSRSHQQLGKAILGATAVASGLGYAAHKRGQRAEKDRQIEMRLNAGGWR